MKKKVFIPILLIVFALTGCGRSMNYIIENEPSIEGIVTQIDERSILIHGQPMYGYPYEWDCKVSLDVENGDSYTDIQVGDEVVVYYDGSIAESDPMQISTVYAITLKTPASRVIDISLPEEITSIEVGGYYNGGVIQSGEFVIKDFDAFKVWFAQLSLEHREFEEGKTPGQTLAGGDAYEFDINNSGEIWFTYVENGTTYIIYGDEWYEVTNPSEPPFEE